MTDLEKRKKLLLAESEVYRQTLKLEMHNLRIYGLKTKRRLTSFQSTVPVFMAGLPMAGSFFRRKRDSSLKRIAAAGLFGWQMYNRFRGMFRPSTSRRVIAPPERVRPDLAF